MASRPNVRSPSAHNSDSSDSFINPDDWYDPKCIDCFRELQANKLSARGQKSAEDYKIPERNNKHNSNNIFENKPQAQSDVPTPIKSQPKISLRLDGDEGTPGLKFSHGGFTMNLQ